MKDRRKVFIYLSVMILLLVGIIISTSFAYFSYSKTISDYIPVNVTIAEGTTANFTASGNTNVSLNISGDKFYKSDAGSVAGSTTTTMNINLETVESVKCSYTLVWNWDSSSDKYKKSDIPTNEFTISGTSTNGDVLNETQLNNYGTSTTLGKFKVTDSSDTSVIWTFTINFYNVEENQDNHAGNTYKGNIGFTNDVNCIATNTIENASTYFINLAKTDTTNLAEDDYDNIRFIGANPNNYACFTDDETTCINGNSSSTNATGGLFRIIGIFNEDTHGQEDEQLVKLISADSIESMPWDYKNGSTSAATASSITTYGSNDWSDSQLMYMLNGSEGNNKGYQSLTPVYGTTTPIRTLTYSSNNVYYNSTNYFYTNNSGYSYLSGSTTSSRTLNIPASVANGANYSSSSSYQRTVNSLMPSQTSMIKEVVWHLGGYSSESILTSEFYTYERGTTTCYSSGNCSATTRPYTWIGKIGLMYPSDYGYATSGGTTINRNRCLTSIKLGGWNSCEDCYQNDWLLYTGSRTGTQGTATDQWTITPSSSSNNAVLNIYSNGVVYSTSTVYLSGIRPVFYLEPSVYVAGGSGTSTDPYLFAIL